MSDSVPYRKVLREQGYYSVDPMPTEEQLGKFYSDRYYQEYVSSSYQASYDKAELEYKSLTAQQYLYAAERICGAFPAGSKLLEVGCGEGFTLSLARQRNWQVSGIDFSDHGLRECNPELLPFVSAGDAYRLLSDCLERKEIHDVVILQNVLEHVREPEKLLESLSVILSEQGVVCITVPNDYSRLQQLALKNGGIEDAFWFCPPQHLHYFNCESFPEFLASVGYDVLDLYADFPIEFYLHHPSSNYARYSEAGKPAHRARVALTLSLHAAGIENYHSLCQALSRCGAGRTVTAIARPI